MPKDYSPGEKFIDACCSGDLAAARKLLDKGVDVNYTDKDGSTALMWASVMGHVEVVKLLLDRGALIDLQNNYGSSALMYASHNGIVDCVRLLLDKGADMSLKAKDDMTAKDKAESNGHVAIVQVLDEVCMLKIVKPHLTCQLITKHETKKNSTPQTQALTEVALSQAQVVGELVMEPLNKALQEENGRLKTEIEVLKERELSKTKEMLLKQGLVDEYKTRATNVEEENQRGKDEIQRGKEEIQRGKEENQRFRDELSSLKEKEIALRVENEFLKRREEEFRVERTADRALIQTMISSLITGTDDRKRKRNDDE